MTLGETIETRRRALGWTQAVLAERSGIDRSYLSHVESGARSLTASSIVTLAEVLELDVAELTLLAARLERERSDHAPSSADSAVTP